MFSILVLFLLIAAAGPASAMSWSECRKADWFQVGMRDGAAGEGSERLGELKRNCALSGAVPDAEAWERGREAGLKVYCTPANAYVAGRRDRDILSLCPKGARARLVSAFEHGSRYREIGLEMAKVKNAYFAARADLQNAFDDTDGMRAFWT